MTAKKDITIYDIAKEAGVSTATVSRILSNTAGVRQDTRARVQAIVDKYNFKPSAIARGLSETHSKVIGMLCPDVRNAYYANIFIECERQAFEKGYTLVLNNTFATESLEVAFIEKLIEQRVESLIVCGGLADWRPLPPLYRETLCRFARRIPVVVAGKMDMEECYQVRIDHEEGMRTTVRHLATLGHRRIAFLHGYSYIYQTQDKLAAFLRTLEEEGLDRRAEYIVDAGEFDEQGGLIGMKRLLSLAEPPTAVIATNDLMAAGALQAILRLGYSVPGDFSIVGFDDSRITDLTEPHISSVHYDYSLYGQRLIDTALAAVSAKACERVCVIPTTLTVKESCRKIEA
jgi:DNA-binding LacI/PurR family transcriptional regulator